MFTKSTCLRSRKARAILTENYPDVDYFYYEYDTRPMGEYFFDSVIQESGTAATPQIYMCNQFIGGILYITLKLTVWKFITIVYCRNIGSPVSAPKRKYENKIRRLSSKTVRTYCTFVHRLSISVLNILIPVKDVAYYYF